MKYNYYSYLFYFILLVILHLVIPVLSAEKCKHPYYNYDQGYCSGSQHCCLAYAYTDFYTRYCCYSYSSYYYSSYSSVGTIVGATLGSLFGLGLTFFVVVMLCKFCGSTGTSGNAVNVNPGGNQHQISTVHVPVQPGQPGQLYGGQPPYGYPPAYQQPPPTYQAPPSTSNTTLPPPNYVENIATSQPPTQTTKE